MWGASVCGGLDFWGASVCGGLLAIMDFGGLVCLSPYNIEHNFSNRKFKSKVTKRFYIGRLWQIEE